MMLDMSSYDVSAAALRPLMQTFWTSKGWRSSVALPAADVPAAAIRSGVMFDQPRQLGHDGWVEAARAAAAAAAVSASEISAAFLVSLTTRRLDLRSALGSFAVARHLVAHRYTPDPSARCAVCGLGRRSTQDLNILNFERFKWGGVRRDDLTYVAFDLEQFQRAPRIPVDDAAIAAGHDLLTTLRGLPEGASATVAAGQLRTVKGNAPNGRYSWISWELPASWPLPNTPDICTASCHTSTASSDPAIATTSCAGGTAATASTRTPATSSFRNWGSKPTNATRRLGRGGCPPVAERVRPADLSRPPGRRAR